MDETSLIAFRDFARERLLSAGKLGTLVGERQFHFLLGLGPEPVSLRALRSGGHPLSRLYTGVTAKTLTRDIHFLGQQRLIVVSGDELRPNLDFMRRFTATRPEAASS